MSKKIKAIFYAYSNNALDHLAPYVFLCNEKKIDCVVIYGEDFIKHKLKPKQNLEKIFFKNNIKTFDISQIKLKGFVYNFYTLLWLLTKVLDENSLVPIFLRMKLKGLCNKIYNCLDGHMIANQLISKFYNDDEKVFVFIDEWSEKKKKIQNPFLSRLKNRSKIIAVGHDVYHFHKTAKIKNDNLSEDIAFLSNKWELIYKQHIKSNKINGNLRYSRRWIEILDKYDSDKFYHEDKKKNVLILTHNQNWTSDWKRMFNLFNHLAKKKNINLKILPHIRGMSNLKPPKELKSVWDKITPLDVAIKKSDIVIFWVSSGFFDAVVRNKKILYLKFLSTIDEKFVWRESILSKNIIKNETELDDALDNFNRQNQNNLENSCFEKLIWPNGDPWENTSKILDTFFL